MNTTPSRQRTYQRRHHAAGLCVLCPEPVWRPNAWECLKHYLAKREAQRERYKCGKRLTNAASYKAQKTALPQQIPQCQ